MHNSVNLLKVIENTLKMWNFRGTWVAQEVEHPTSAWVMISRFVGPSPTSGSVLTVQSLEPALDSVSPPLSAPPRSCSVSLCLSIINQMLK